MYPILLTIKTKFGINYKYTNKRNKWFTRKYPTIRRASSKGEWFRKISRSIKARKQECKREIGRLNGIVQENAGKLEGLETKCEKM